jgi:hypothetical protein
MRASCTASLAKFQSTATLSDDRNWVAANPATIRRFQSTATLSDDRNHEFSGDGMLRITRFQSTATLSDDRNVSL